MPNWFRRYFFHPHFNINADRCRPFLDTACIAAHHIADRNRP
nr:MAG TPA_asm: hypothetical protein [Caudoviricetes sp.]